MSKETTMINIRGAWVDTRKYIDCFVNLRKDQENGDGRNGQ